MNSNPDVLKKITDIFNSKPQFFGEGKFYQSFPKLNIDGFRDTKERLENYHLESVLFKEADVLDLGCNCGFFDLEICERVNSITGVEYNEVLVDVANTVKDSMGITNVDFYPATFQEWYKSNTRKYDVVLSFAVHRWFKIPSNMYAKQIDSLLKDDGVLVFETQDITGDIWYPSFLREFDCRGFTVESCGVGFDDRKYYRKFYVLRRKVHKGRAFYCINKMKTFSKVYV